MSPLTMPPFLWQDHAWQAFVRRVRAQMLPHALLVTGARGIGVEKMGRAMAHYLLCRSPLESVACGQCKGCLLVSAGSHPDLMEVAPAEAGKAIRVDQIREITNFVAKTAQQGGRKLILVDPAEAMNANAANSLLKCLEEPAGDTVIILVATEPSLLMPTIRSRCSKIELATPSHAQSFHWLEEVGVKNPSSLLAETGSAPLLAFTWSQNDTFNQRQKMCKELADLSRSLTTVSSIAKSWGQETALNCVNVMIGWLERIIRERHSPVEKNSENWESLLQATNMVSESLLFRYREALCIRKAQLQSSANLNANLVVEEILLDWKAMLMMSQRLMAGKISL